ncbi:MAG: tetraacyldisaccharide 4'-kinase [Bacteroidota bacterium]|nr:tetraacyldisaccharide 4'-kinase [Bacteroidota bacterium]
MKSLFAILLIPFSFLYGIGVSIYQSFYFSGFFKSTKFSIPIIGIGNLSVGGTGKSPHIEYLVRTLKPYIPVAIISRGYGRKTQGYLLVTSNLTSLQTGDESLQIKSKFNDIPVAVSENRSVGIPKLLSQHPEIKVILMDDAFQHLEVQPSLNILLTEFNNPYFKDFLIPSGRLREWRFGVHRANVIIVTKCSSEPSPEEQNLWVKNLKLNTEQQLFFSYMEYGTPYHLFHNSQIFKLNPSLHVILVSAIAQASYITEYLEDKVSRVDELQYEDHHYFKEQEINELIYKFNAISHSNKMILTTEKDATRLILFKDIIQKANIEIYVLPVDIRFYKQPEFDRLIKDHLLEFKI